LAEGGSFAFIVEKSLAGLAVVAGAPFQSLEKVWDNGLFPHRIPMKFTHVVRTDERPPILGEVRDALTQQWGPKYGWAILNQQVLESPNAAIVARAITLKANALAEYQESLTERLEGVCPICSPWYRHLTFKYISWHLGKDGTKSSLNLDDPTFRKIGLNDYCRYIAMEDLSDLTTRFKGYDGHIQPSILDKIAVALEDEEDREDM
jgi:hypothetical protein